MALRLGFLRALIYLGASAACIAGDHSIKLSLARKLVHKALVALDQDGPKVRIVEYRYDYAPEFYSFMAWWPNPDGDPLIGYFAVNPWTGDVWDIMGCRRVSSADLEKEQDAIWARLRLLPEARGTLRAKSPACGGIERKTSGHVAPAAPVRRRPNI
jgi:hypothetical protein